MFEQIKAIMVRKFQLDPADVLPDASLTDLQLDSLDLVELSLVLEKELNARISDDELAEAQQLDAIVDLVAQRGAKV
ncbi:acyl carrier protein [Micromonospora maritima]|uniref:Acyl carrier protein n=1 Tax=Micromonospora maritima TaxID=986711 RepID=A0ABW7ZJU7_9ACTN